MSITTQATQAIGNDRETRRATPGWTTVALRELADLWIGGRALILLILFSILLGVMSFLLATNSELSMLTPEEMLFLELQTTITVGLFIGLLLGADSISGERERATLEGLLLTPTRRSHIIIGKFLAAISPWPGALAVAAIHLSVLTANTGSLIQALIWGALLGSLLVVGFTGFGMLVSIGVRSNRTSIIVSLVVALLLLIPTQFPGSAQAGFMGRLVKRINPMESINQFLEKVVVNNRTIDEMASWLAAPVLFAAIILFLLFWYTGPHLRLEGGWPSLVRKHTGRGVSLSVVLSLFLWGGAQTMLAAQPAASLLPAPAGQEVDPGMQIAIDMEFNEIKTGDEFTFTSVVTYEGTDESQAAVVAMNLVNLGDGDPVDPEDWSPERTQEVEPLTEGGSATQVWTIHAILPGDYLIYLVVIPEPDGPQETSVPIASSGIHMTVAPFAQLNPGGVAPVALGIPIALSLILMALVWIRRRHIETVSALSDPAQRLN